MPDRFVRGLANFVVGHRLAVILTVIALTGLLGSQIPKLKANFTPEDLYARVQGQDEIAAAFEAAFGNTDNVVLVLIEADDVLSLEALQYVHDVSRRFQGEPGIGRVASITVTPLPRASGSGADTLPPNRDAGPGSLSDLFGGEARLTDLTDLIPDVEVDAVVEGDRVEPADVDELRRALQDAPLVEGKLVSRDRQVAAVVLELDRDVQQNGRIADVVGGIADWVESHPPPDGVRALLAGLPYVRLVIVSKMRTDQKVLLPAAIVVCLVILALSFRWPSAVVLSTLGVIMSAVMVVGGMALVGEPINVINNTVSMLVLIIGISSAIHLVNRYADEYRATQSQSKASRRSLRAMTVALFLTSFTTAAGFGSLMVSTTPMLSRFGLTAAIGVLIAYVVSITFLPAALTYARPPRHWKGWKGQGWLERAIGWSTKLVIRYRWPVLAYAVVSFVAAVLIALHLDIDSSVLDQFDEDDEIYQTARFIEEHLEGMRALEISLESSREGRFDEPDALNAMTAVQHWAEQQPGVLGTMSYAELLHEGWYRLTGDPGRREADFDSPATIAALGGMMDRAGVGNPAASYVTPDRRRARINIQVAETGSQATRPLIEGLRARLVEEFGPLDDVRAELTGDAYIAGTGLDLVMRDLVSSLLAAFLIIFGVLALILRSWRLGLLSIPPNVIPLVTTMAYMVARGIPLNLATVIIFSISIGMAVDGTIHVLARFREELARSDEVEEALLAAVQGTGKAILFTCLSLMLGFAVMFLSTFPPVRRFGELIAVTMGACLVATLFLVPALLRVSFPTLAKAKAVTGEYELPALDLDLE